MRSRAGLKPVAAELQFLESVQYTEGVINPGGSLFKMITVVAAAQLGYTFVAGQFVGLG